MNESAARSVKKSDARQHKEPEGRSTKQAEIHHMKEAAKDIEGLCSLCGARGSWEYAEGISIRENYRCSKCKASLRYRDQAAAITTYLGRGAHATLRDLVRDKRFQALSVYEIALRGPFIKYLSGRDRYVRSHLWPDVPLGQVRNKVRCEDLGDLTFNESQFDLVVSSDVLEHVFNYEEAFKELFRVLKPGGYHIFTVPLGWPIPEATFRRATEIDGHVEHHAPARFTNSGDGSPSLVCTDFGRDLPDLLADIGYEAWFCRPSVTTFPLYRHAIVVSHRPK